MTVLRSGRGTHVVGVCPNRHDLVEAHVSHGEVFGGPHRAAAAVSRGGDASAHIADMPGHVIGRHDLCGGLRNGIHNGIFDEGGESVRDAQRVHREDQFIRADLLRRRSLYRLEGADGEEDKQG